MLTYNDVKVGSVLRRNPELGTDVTILILTNPDVSIISGYFTSKVMHLAKDRYGLIQDRYILYTEYDTHNEKQQYYWSVLC